ncbi:transcription factor Sp4 [Drosophila eugracilis]|uniref:transcription factor Sp4 n=1 Tax=Drosophila eugracilis TaxID=29029 RepID=UPI001BD9EFD7|nr:transcription factor Sp4 [Drosophila eugracilis]
MAAAGNNVRCINYYDLCRICTDSSDHKTDIYSPEGRAKNLSHKILECLSLQIDEKDRLPKVVCAQCVQLVEQIYGLRATCRNSQTMLSNCLNIRPPPSTDKLYIRDAVDESGKSLSVAQAAPAGSNGPQQSGNLLNTIIQAVGMQPQQQYTITVDNGIQQHQVPSEVQIKSERQTALEEFIRLKPDIKITPLGKKDSITPAKAQQAPLQPQAVTTTVNTPQLQLQPQLGEQLQPLWQQIQQLQLHQQLQQLTSQLQATTQYSATQEDSTNPGDSKKPKLNFVLSSPTAPQFTTALPQFGGSQPQIQLQLMSGGGAVANSGAGPAQSQFNAAALLSSLAAPQSTPNLLSPNKCFLPITIRDENSDQQIVAHIDTKNLVLPTTYQVQMKLQPQLATADGQPIMQLTPTSIPATLQLTPQTMGNTGTNFQGTATAVAQNQFLAPQLPPPQSIQQQQTLTQLPNTAQVTSQQIIRSPQTNNTNSQLVIRNVTNIPTTPTTPTSTKEALTFKTPSPKQRQMPSPKSKPAVVSPSGGSNGTANNEFKRLMTQTRPPQVKQQQPAAVAASAPQTTVIANQAAMQRLSSNTTITKVAKQSAPTSAAVPTPSPAKLPMLNKQNITISRISMQTPPKPQLKPPATAASTAPQPIPVSVPALNQTQPPPLAAQHKKIVRKPPENQETPAQKKPARPPQQILPSPNQEGQNATNSENDALSSLATPALICPTCKREFKKKEHLTQHVKLHAGLRPFKCSEEGCDKTFSRKEHLSRHLISHSGQKMYTCEVCKKPFSRKDNLNKHKRIHTQPTNETLYCCDVCNKNFATKLHYEKHREMHKKTRPESVAPAATVPSAGASAPPQVRSNGQAPSKAVYEIKQRTPQQQQQSHNQQTHSQAQPAQIMHVVTTQDLAGNTITITQSPDSNMPASLANYVQLGFSQFQNPSAPAAK